MDLNEILIFTWVVRAGSFTAAARTLGMPKSTVSRKVSDLEDRLGVRLLQRTTRKLGLTDAGRVYFEHGQRIVDAVEEADQAVGQMQAAPRGVLRVTAPLSFSMLGPIVAEYLRRFPDVQVELVCTDRRVDLIEERFDVAIRAGALEDSTLIARSLGSVQRILVASPAYFSKRGTPGSPAELPHHECLAFGTGVDAHLWTLHQGSRTVEVRIDPSLVVNDLEILRVTARAGLGISWIPRFVCVDDLRDGTLLEILQDWRSAESPVHAVYPSTRHLSPKVVSFVAFISERLRLSE